MTDILVKILYALPVYQSIILTFFLFTSGSQKPGFSRLIMGVFQLLMAYYFTFNFLYIIKSFEWVGYAYFLILPVILLFVPVFYLYMLSITTPGFQFQKKQFYHFIPAGFIGILNIPYLFTSPIEKYQFITHGYNMINPGDFYSYLLAIYVIGLLLVFTFQLIFYSIKAIKLYRIHKLYIENRFSFTENINLDWLLSLIICFSVFFVFNDILYLVGFRQNIIIQTIYIISMLMVTLYIGYRGLLQIDINKEDIKLKNETKLQVESATSNTKNETLDETIDKTIESNNYDKFTNTEKSDNIKKYLGSTLSDEQKKYLIISLENLIQYDKIFINDKLTIEDVAIKLNTNTKYISQIINETYNKNFYNYINTFRIEEAKKLLLSNENEKYSILGIAQSVGFVSKSTFNTAFKKHTGLTPTEFKNSQLSK